MAALTREVGPKTKRHRAENQNRPEPIAPPGCVRGHRLFAHFVNPWEESDLPEFTLPSGRTVKTEDTLLWGHELHITSEGLDKGTEAYTTAKFAAIVPAMSLEDIYGLSREDGRALNKEVTRIFLEAKRSVEAERPFGKGSRQKSRA